MASNAGRVLVINKGPWNAAASYLPMDEVFYDGSSYLCKAAVSSVTTPDKDLAHWQIHAKGATDEMIEHLEVSPYMRETLGELPTDIRDADTLGGMYSSGDIDAIDARVTGNTEKINTLPKAHLISVSGTTESSGIITVADTHITDFSQLPYCITNYSRELSYPYSITVNGWTSTTVSFRIRKMSDNTAVGNTNVSFSAILIGF